ATNAYFGNTYRILKEASITSCPIGDNSWYVKASTIKNNIKHKYADLYNPRFYIKGVPIFYFPFWRIPVTNQRQSGLLLPKLNWSTKSGASWIQPIYWNIAPNFDATIAPGIYTKRGFIVDTKVRYLTHLGQGYLVTDYMPHDWIAGTDRYFIKYYNYTPINKHWSVTLNYEKVSDTDFFTDFNSIYGNSTTNYTEQSFNVNGGYTNYNLSVVGEHYEVLNGDYSSPYEVLPEVNFEMYNTSILGSKLEFSFNSQVARFITSDYDYPDAWRFNIVPELTLPYRSHYFNASIQTKLYVTSYEQTMSGEETYDVASSETRVIPELRINFDTKIKNNYKILGYTETITPRIQYLYKSYRDQSGIGVYDTSLIQSGYNTLFGDRAFSGYDRIASANQLSAGFSTDFYNNDGIKKLTLVAGELIYFKDPKTTSSSTNEDMPSMAVVGGTLNILPNLHLESSFDFDNSASSAAESSTMLDYQYNNKLSLGLSYRYMSNDMINKYTTILDSDDPDGYDIEGDINQAGISVSYQIDKNWGIRGAYYRNLSLNILEEEYVGVSYGGLCWSIDVGYSRYLSDYDTSTKTPTYSNGFGVSFTLTDFGTDLSNITQMEDANILPYVNPFNN
ncbi:MAG: LPS assembly protein LptD, partial [Psittacicella sp.]